MPNKINRFVQMPKIGVMNPETSKIELTVKEWADFQIWVEQLLYKLEIELITVEDRVTVLEP